MNPLPPGPDVPAGALKAGPEPRGRWGSGFKREPQVAPVNTAEVPSRRALWSLSSHQVAPGTFVLVQTDPAGEPAVTSHGA